MSCGRVHCRSRTFHHSRTIRKTRTSLEAGGQKLAARKGKRGNRRGQRLHIPTPAGYGPLPFSSGVLIESTLYLSGHMGLDPATKKPPAEALEEARMMLDAFRETLSRTHFAMDDLVFVQVFCSDVSLFEKFNSVYRTYFAMPLPARAFIGSGPLLFGARFEIQGIAVKGSEASPKRRRR